MDDFVSRRGDGSTGMMNDNNVFQYLFFGECVKEQEVGNAFLESAAGIADYERFWGSKSARAEKRRVEILPSDLISRSSSTETRKSIQETVQWVSFGI